MKKNQHVVSHEGEWAVKGEGNTKSTKITETKAEAIKIAKSIADNKKAVLIVLFFLFEATITILEKRLNRQ